MLERLTLPGQQHCAAEYLAEEMLAFPRVDGDEVGAGLAIVVAGVAWRVATRGHFR